jgi:CDP-4-dehydro-6-deoxyglucose reductase
LKNIKTSFGKLFEQLENESILSSAEKAGINFQYSCRTGRCSTCKCKVISGKTDTYSGELGLSEEEKLNGYILSCVRYALEDIEIEIDDLGDIEIPKPKTIPCKINSIHNVSEDVIQLTLRIPPNTNFNFIPGQYVDMISPDGVKRSYSIANNFQENLIELHIKKVINGDFSKYWFDRAQEDDLLRLNGPHGTFFLREKNDKGIIFLATGTGIAPVKSIIESLEKSSNFSSRQILLLWGGRKSSDLYLNSFHENTSIEYIPVLSRPSSDWLGKSGYIQNVLLEEKYDISKYIVYACGSDKMIASAKELLINNGLDEHDFFSDAFLPSSDIILK